MRPPLAGRAAAPVDSLEAVGAALSLGLRGAFLALDTSSHWEIVPIGWRVSQTP
jgi:hypothetical protein